MEPSSQPATVRPTKKQRELLMFIGTFIAEHGYSPSYREIMHGLGYTSVATVALHVNSLIKRGHIRKRDFSARSLEIVNAGDLGLVPAGYSLPKEGSWLVEKTEQILRQLEQGTTTYQPHDVQILVEALRVLGYEAAVDQFRPRVAALERRADSK